MIYVLIPSFNDAANFHRLVPSIVKHLKKSNFKIIIVDDGSTDNTIDTIKNLSKTYPVKRIGYKKNAGPGFAFKYGFKYLLPKLKKDDKIMTMEADNTTDFKILGKMIEKSKRYDVVLASVYAAGGTIKGMGVNRIILSYAASLLDCIFFRLKGVRTYSSFYRIYTGPIIKKALTVYKDKIITESGFSSVIELLIKLNKIGATFGEVPSTLDWKHKKGGSKMKIGKTALRHFNLYKNYLQGKF